MLYRIYIIDDEEPLAKGLALALKDEYNVDVFFDGLSALQAINENPPDIVLLDISMPGIDGIEVLKRIQEDFSDIAVIMISAMEEINTVVKAMRIGAYDYVLKPICMDLLNKSIKNAIENFKLVREVRKLQEQYIKENIPCFIGNSKEIRQIMQTVESIAKSSDTPVMIFGESGTGKELIAKAIHFRSPNFKGELVSMNCAAIPKDLIESELFGYEKGAFSGANQSGKKGIIEQADKGTLFLDEIGDLSMEAQAKLLRFLETGEFYRIGGIQKHHIQTRIVSATNKDIEKMMHLGLFRKDLYFRISVVKIAIPSLNSREEDIVLIARSFLTEFSKKFNKNFTRISNEAEKALVDYHWVGNIRELRNVIERAALISNGPELSSNDLGLPVISNDFHQSLSLHDFTSITPGKQIHLDNILESIERQYYEAAMKATSGNETKAAELLNVNYSTFRYRRKKLDNIKQ